MGLYLSTMPKNNKVSIWRFNSSLLQEANFNCLIKREIDLFKKTNLPSAPSPEIVWETLKSFIRGSIIQYASHKKRMEHLELQALEKEVTMTENLYKITMSNDNFHKLLQLKYKYNTLLSQKVQFSLFRARQQYFEEGGKPGQLLANYIKQQESQKVISAIRDHKGILHTSPEGINEIFKDFYQNLYKSQINAKKEEIATFLTELCLPQISDSQKIFLDAPISIKEILSVINTLPSGKAPGPDGFTPEFYKEYAEELAPLLLDMFNASLVEGTFPPTVSQAVITLIPKKDKDLTDCRNYRPISLTNYDCKIFSKILANRLNVVTPTLIHLDQVGFISNRQASDNIRRFINIMWHVKERDTPTAALSLDAEKAFDRVEWEYLFLVLEHMGFGKDFLNKLRLLYRNSTASVLTNGYMSPYFKLGRGSRQGDPSSPAAFALALEPLAIAIRNNSNFTGVQIGTTTHKLMLYADDILTVVTNPEISIPTLFSIIESFSRLSGYKINWDKCEALPLTIHCPKTYFHVVQNLKWPTVGLRYLGVVFPSDLSDIVKLNIEPVLLKFAEDIKRWERLHLSLWAKANILKMTVVPKFNYIMHSLPISVPSRFFKKFNQLCRLFLWEGKKPKIRLERLQQRTDAGGLGIPNLLLYHYAFCLHHIAQWTLPPERAPPWYELEALSCPTLPHVCFFAQGGSYTSHTDMSYKSMAESCKNIKV